VTRWARLTWQAPDADALAETLARRLGIARGWAPGRTWRFPLGPGVLEVVPWRREGPDDEPAGEGRLVFEPVEEGMPDPVPDNRDPLWLAGIAWSTVDLDRAEAELGPWLDPPDEGDRAPAAVPDPHLGARIRVRATAGLPGERILLAEPITEGRLAASLARDDEGPCALYLRPREGLEAWTAAARGRGVLLTARRDGPLGPSVLVLGGVVAGPHLLVVEGPAPRARATSGRAAAGTIAP
jgi:hypothetical protein